MNSSQAPIWDFSIGRRSVRAAWLAALVVANLCALLPVSQPLKAAGGFLLFGFLSGAALVSALFPLDSDLEWAERIAFSVGMSVALSLQATWFYGMAAGRMSLPGLLVVLNVLALGAAGVAVWRRRAQLSPGAVRVTITRGSLVSIGLILLVALTCFLWLDYSDYDLDEVPVLDSAAGMILGDQAAVYHLAKGPAQVVMSAAFILFGDSVAEGFVRIPFAMMTVAAALAFLGLSKRVLGPRGAWVASLCLALDGFSISKGRVVQFQTLVFPFVFLAFAAFFLGARTAERAPRRRFQLAGALFGGLGLFAHYTGAFILPALAALWLWSERDSLKRRTTWLYAAVLASVGALSGMLFYGLMLRQPNLADKVGSYYVGFRLGSGPFNMLGNVISHIRLYESPPWILFVGVGLLAMATRTGGRLLRAQRSLGVLYFGALGASLVVLLLPGAFIVMGFDLAFLPFTILGICLALGVTLSIDTRGIGIWMLGALLVPAFWMQIPGNHYNLVLAPAILLAVLGWRELMRLAGQRIPRRAWPIAAAAASIVAVALVVWGLSYVYEMFIAHTPEYAVLYPDRAPQPIALFAGDAPAVKYDIPHNNGWRAIAALYDAGILRGEFRTNELLVPPNWYLAQRWKPDQPQPRYYFFVPNQQVPALGSAPPANLAERFWLWGRIMVADEPRMLIYQLRDGQPAPQPRTLAVEDFGKVWQRLATLTRLAAYRELHRDDTAFYAVAHFLESAGGAGDAVVFDDDLERGLLSRFYRGDMPYQPSVESDSLATYRRIWAIYWASPDRTVERALAENACPAASQWFGNLRLVLNGTGDFSAPVGINARLGDSARLEAYALDNQAPQGGDVFCVRLDWNVIAPTAEPLKLFVHLVTSDGKLAAQTDTEPQAGFKPTTEWRAGERFADRVGIALPAQLVPGRYRLLGGLYDAQSGARVSAYAADGTRYPDDAVELGIVTIQ